MGSHRGKGCKFRLLLARLSGVGTSVGRVMTGLEPRMLAFIFPFSLHIARGAEE